MGAGIRKSMSQFSCYLGQLLGGGPNVLLIGRALPPPQYLNCCLRHSGLTS